MARSPEKHAELRRLYIRERLSIAQAAAAVGVAPATARGWKARDKRGGDDWDKARAAARMAAGKLGDVTAQVLEEFSTMFQATIPRLREQSENDPIAAAQAIAQLSDAYTKTVRAAGGVDPRAGKLAVALEVLEKLGDYIKQHCPQHGPVFVEILEPFGQELSREYG